MKIYKNVLSNDLFKETREYLFSILTKEVWSSSLLSWDKNVHLGLKGSCNTSSIPKVIHRKIEKQIKHCLPEYKKLTSQFNVWNFISGVSIHDDSKSSFGVTIYLNDYWEYNYGGLFIWKDNNSDYTDINNVICPQRNMMILNDNKEYHMVTPVSFDIPEPRFSIQIWGY